MPVEQTTDAPKTKTKRDGVLVRFVHPYGIYQVGDEALFDKTEAVMLCGIEEGRPKGNPKAVGKVIGYNKNNQTHKADCLPD